MPKIYDNISNHLTKGLTETLEVSKRTDFCVGYFNLRGWKEVATKIDDLSGGTVFEGGEDVHRNCRLLVGMQKMPEEILREYFRNGDELQLDNNEASKIRRKVAEEFKAQLTIGAPTEVDEAALRRLSKQLKAKKVVVKLHLRYSLHAKLYLAYSDDKRVPIVGFLGSSNLTLAGLVKQGELNIDVMDQDAAQKLADWFDARWNDRWCIDITDELIEIIDESWAWLVAADRLASSLSQHARKKTISTSQGHTIEYDEIKAAYSKPDIDEIDKVLAKHYGFTDEELDFIINYDIKYRMGRELDSDE